MEVTHDSMKSTKSRADRAEHAITAHRKGRIPGLLPLFPARVLHTHNARPIMTNLCWRPLWPPQSPLLILGCPSTSQLEVSPCHCVSFSFAFFNLPASPFVPLSVSVTVGAAVDCVSGRMRQLLVLCWCCSLIGFWESRVCSCAYETVDSLRYPLSLGPAFMKRLWWDKGRAMRDKDRLLHPCLFVRLSGA